MKLVKISASSVQIKSNDKEFEGLRINDLMRITDGTANLVVMVSNITSADTDDDEMFIRAIKMRVVDCDIIGSITDGHFHTDINTYPTTDVSISGITQDEFRNMLMKFENNGFKLGMYADYEADAYVNANKLFQRHACLLGNTGSGKSETVAKILQEISKKRATNVLVFDIHGEYSNISYVKSYKVGTADCPIPIWMFGFNGIVSNILRIKEESSTVVMTALRKCYYQVCPEGKENKPIWFDYRALINAMVNLNTEVIGTGDFYKTGDRAGQEKTKAGEFNGKLDTVIAKLKDRLEDSRYKFLFNDPGQGALHTLFSILFEKGGVKSFDFSDVPHDVAVPIIGIITKLAYDGQRTQRDICPMVIFCDEAHVYIPASDQLSSSQRRMTETFEEIAKEGRKFGVTLFPATQRPSELNRTILAQCGNFIVMKLNNENDKTIVKGMLPEGNVGIVESTTMFRPGDCIVIGDASPIPIKVHVDLADERPTSRTIDFWSEWDREREQADVNDIISSYLSSF